MRFLGFTIFAFFSLSLVARASADYGHDVKIGSGGEWIDRNGNRVWANERSQSPNVISMNNSEQRNGELAYQTAYDSYVFGKNNGLNKVQHVKNGGRWTHKITTGDGIVIFKDQAGNVAVQTPDGRWNVTDARGEYASSGVDLERDLPTKTMVAGNDAKKPAAAGRQLASVKESAPKEGAMKEEAPAEESAASEAEVGAAEAAPAAATPPAVAEETSTPTAAPAPVAATAAATAKTATDATAPAGSASAATAPAAAAAAPTGAPAAAAPVSLTPISLAPPTREPAAVAPAASVAAPVPAAK